MGILDNALGGLFSSPQIPPGGLMGEARPNPIGDAKLAFASQLLAGANSYGGQFAPILGNALQAGQQARMQAQQLQQQQVDQQLKRQYMQAQINALQAKEPSIGAVSPEKFTPESLAAFYAGGGRDYSKLVPTDVNKHSETGFGNVNPGDFDPKDLAAYQRSVNPKTGLGDFSLLNHRVFAPQQAWVGMVNGGMTAVPRTGGGIGAPQVLSTLPTEAAAASTLAGAKAGGEVLGTADANAKVALPQVEATAANALKTVDALLKHPGLPYITGVESKLPILPGSQQAGADALAKQVEGQTFLTAFQQLRGAGAITEVEGTKGTAAIGRLQRSQSTDEYKGALIDLKEVISRGVLRAQQKAQAPQSPPTNRPPLSDFHGPGE